MREFTLLRFPTGTRSYCILPNVHTGSGTHSTFCSPGCKDGRSAMLTTNPHQMQTVRMGGAILPLPPVRLHGVRRENYYFLLPLPQSYFFPFIFVHKSHSRSQASAAGALNSSVFWIITQRKLVKTDVSELPIAPIFKGPAIQEEASNPGSSSP